MAKNKYVPGLEVHVVLIDQTELEEWPDRRNPDDTVTTHTCYVESISNFQFFIRIKYDSAFPPDKHIGETVFVDGKKVCHSNLENVQIRDRIAKYTKGNCKPFRNAGFFFNPITMDDIDCDIDDDQDASDFGTITVQFDKLKIRERRMEPTDDEVEGEKEEDRIPESSFKGDLITHKVGFKKPQKRKAKPQPLFEEESLLAIFHFKYRSKESLKTLHVTPCDLGKALDLTNSRCKVVRQVKDPLYHAKCKREHKDNEPQEISSSDEDSDCIVLKQGPAQKKFKPGEMIDLT